MQELVITTRTELQAIIIDAVSACLQHKEPAKQATVGKPVTTEELCKHLNISKPTALRYRKKGKIPFIQIGGAIRYDLNAVIAALQKGKCA